MKSTVEKTKSNPKGAGRKPGWKFTKKVTFSCDLDVAAALGSIDNKSRFISDALREKLKV